MIAVALLMAAEAVTLNPFTFRDLSSEEPITSETLRNKNYKCFEAHQSNITWCDSIITFMERAQSLDFRLANGRLSQLSLEIRYVDKRAIKPSLIARYGPECRPSTWCFKTGELTISGDTNELGAAYLTYKDRMNVEVKDAPKPIVDF